MTQTNSNYIQKEGFINGYQDLQLFYQCWEKKNAKGSIIFTHGLGEHSDSYHRLIENFKNDHWNFYGWDLRGHGKSEGKRGYVEGFNNFVYDLEIIVQHLKNNIQIQEPIILLGHSLGGLITTKYLLLNDVSSISGVVLSSPGFGFALDVPFIKDRAARILKVLLPKITLWNEITYDMLTRDEDVIKEFEKDHLRHDLISSGIYLGMIESIDFIFKKAKDLKLPLFLQISDKDPVVSTSAAKDFYSRISSKNKRIILYPDGAKHENYNDIHRLEVYADLKKFLDGLL